ncbi:hypothetical protein K5549_007927 [Capra hircus]|nr:hypothetical protein K5549_007927 [Capra hircus]
MEADGDLEELARLRSVFAACDANRSGRLEREEFRALCAELRVRPADAEAVFQRLDADRDGAITFQEFARGFRGARRGGPRRGWGPREPAPAAAQVGSDPGSGEEDEGDEDAAAALAAPWDPASSGQAWQDFQARLGDEVKFIPRKEQVSTLYQNINLVEPRLIQPYEHVIKNFIREIKLQSTEMENLAIAVKRAQDKAAMQLSELEEEMDQRIQAAENKTRKDEKRKAEEALSDLRRQYETEVGDLQVTIKKLKKLEEQSKHISQKQDVAALKKQIYDLSMENQKVKKDLLEAQTNIAFLQSELDSLKSDYADQSLNSERQYFLLVLLPPDNVRSSRCSYMDEDCDSLALCDPMQRMNCDVDSLPESCFDSGLSTLRDSNEYDSEVEYKHQRGFQKSHGMQESFGGDASDTDTDMVDESHKSSSSQKAYKIVLAGDAAVGKSSFLMRLCKNEFRGNTSATLDSEALPSLTSEEQMVFCCCMMLRVRKAFLMYENG